MSLSSGCSTLVVIQLFPVTRSLFDCSCRFDFVVRARQRRDAAVVTSARSHELALCNQRDTS
jgi:hypothetical protein